VAALTAICASIGFWTSDRRNVPCITHVYLGYTNSNKFFEGLR